MGDPDGEGRPRAIRPAGGRVRRIGAGTVTATADVDTGPWQVLASFVIEFRARRRGDAPERIAVHHVELDRTEIVDGDGAASGSGVLVALDRPWSVVFEWSTEDTELPAGDRLLDVILEPIGPGSPRTLRTHPVPVPAPRPSCYREHFVVAPDALPRTCTGTLFRATATLRFRNAAHERALLAGMVDLGVLRFWFAGPSLCGAPGTTRTGAR